MRLPRVRFRLRTMMLLVAICVVATGVLVADRKRAFNREQAANHALLEREYKAEAALARERATDLTKWALTLGQELDEGLGDYSTPYDFSSLAADFAIRAGRKSREAALAERKATTEAGLKRYYENRRW